MEQDDLINYTNGIYEVAYATYTATETSISDVKLVMPTLETVKEKLKRINTDLSKLGSGFKVLQSSQYPLSIGDNTLRFGVAEWNDNCFSNDTFTAKNKGRYNFHALMQFVISEETRVAVFFKVNGVSVAYTTDELISFNKIVRSDMYCNLNVGDTVQLCVYTNKSASLQNGFSFVGELIKPL